MSVEFDVGDVAVITRDGVTKNTPVIIIQKLLKDTYEVETTEDPPNIIIVPERDLISFDKYLEDMDLLDLEFEELIDFESLNLIDFEELFNSFTERVCECGAEKIGIPGHSHWCPKHE